MSKQTKNTKSAKNADDSFISEESLGSGSASYMKLENGDNKVRIISKPIAGYVEWIDDKPVRTPMSDGEPEATDDEKPPKKFIAVALIDQEDDTVKILEVTQQSIIKPIRTLANNPDWGNPFTYDINIHKSGEGLKTKYVVTPSPKKALSKEAIKNAGAKPCALEQLFQGEDPWKTEDADEVTEYFFK